MDLLVSGAIIFVVGAVLFWYCLPRGGKTHRFVGTELEPYIAVAFCAAVHKQEGARSTGPFFQNV
jgi:hypothetical protein